MKLFKTKVIALMLVLSMALTGCYLDQTATMKVNANKTITAVATIVLDQEAADALAKQSGVEDIYESAKGSGLKISEDTIDGVVYYTLSDENTVSLKTFKETTGQEWIVTQDTVFYSAGNATQIVGGSDMGDMSNLLMLMEANKELKDAEIKITLKVEMPEKIVLTNGVIDKDNNRVAVFEESIKTGFSKYESIFVTTKEGVTYEMVKKSNTIGKTKITSAKAKKKSATIKFKKVTGAKGYKVQYSTNKYFTKVKTKKIKKTSVILKKLKSNKKYYVRVQAYKKNYALDTVYGKWAKKTFKTKK